MHPDALTVTTQAPAAPEVAWRAYTTPSDICVWNAASDDWHTPRAEVDLRVGGRFCWRMEARDGSMGFDFEGEYTAVDAPRHLAYRFGERQATVDFTPEGEGTRVTVRFEPETTHPLDLQRTGWQSILDRFAQHVATLRSPVRFGHAIAYVPDVAASMEFMARAFGLAPRFLHESGDYGEMETGATALAFASHRLAEAHFPHGHIRADRSEAPLGHEVALVVGEVESAHRRALRAGARELRPPAHMPWGQTVSWVRCPDGTVVELCTEVEPAS